MRVEFEVDKATDEVTPAFAVSDDAPLTKLPKMKTSDFIKKFFNQTSISIGILPPAVRWISKDRRIVVFERPPFKAFMEIAPGRKEAAASLNKYSFEVPMPWTVYVGYYDFEYNPVHIRVYTRPTALTGLDDRLYLLPIPNIYMDSSLCNPISPNFVEHDADIAWGVGEVYNMVWNSGFNYDLLAAMSMGIHAGQPVGNNAPRLNRNLDANLQWIDAWSKVSLPDVLKAAFPNPSISRMDQVPQPLTLQGAITAVNNEVMYDSSLAEELITQLVNRLT